MLLFSASYVLRALVGVYATTGGWTWFRTNLFNSYRPELHYMRGPGPKAREMRARSGSIA